MSGRLASLASAFRGLPLRHRDAVQSSFGEDGRYVVERMSGSRGRDGGATLEGVDAVDGTPVEIRVLAGRVSTDAEGARRLEPLRRQIGLEHPALWHVRDAGRVGDRVYVVTDPVPGATLPHVTASGALDPWRALAILGPVLDALGRLHAAGVVHGCIGPECVRVDHADRGRLVDCAVAGAAGGAPGPPRYLAPEQRHGGAPDERSDIFAFATLVLSALEGAAARPGGRRSYAEPPHLPPVLHDVLDAARADDPGRRPSSASELLARLESALAVTVRDTRPGRGKRVRRTVGGLRRVAGAADGDAAAKPPAATSRGAAGTPPTAGGDPAANTRAAAPGGAPAAGWRPPQGPAIRARLAARARDRRWMIAAGAAGALALAGATALAVSLLGGGDDDAGPAFQTLRSDALTVAIPGDWRVGQPPSMPGLPLRAAVGATAGERRNGWMAAGESVGRLHPLLLPAAFVELLPAPPTEGRAVRIRAGTAQRYVGLRPVWLDGRMTVYVLPTARGVTTLVCVTPDGAPARFAARCERAAASLRPTAAVEPPTAADAYRGALRRARTGVRGGAARALPAIDASFDFEERARLARRAARTLALSRLALEAAGPPVAMRSAHAAAVRAVARARAAYAELATVSERFDLANYQAARDAAAAEQERAEAALRRAQRAGRAAP